MPRRKYTVTFSGDGMTTYETESPPRVGQHITTPIGKMRVLEVTAPASFARAGKLRAEPAAGR
jgi:hypothetical protein